MRYVPGKCCRTVRKRLAHAALPALVVCDVCAHHLESVADAAPELSDVGGCLAERVLQAVQCNALLTNGALDIRNPLTRVARGVIELVLRNPQVSEALIQVAAVSGEVVLQGLKRRGLTAHGAFEICIVYVRCMRWCRTRLAFLSDESGVAQECWCGAAIRPWQYAGCQVAVPCCVG